jgi:hypothetical protein
VKTKHGSRTTMTPRNRAPPLSTTYRPPPRASNVTPLGLVKVAVKGLVESALPLLPLPAIVVRLPPVVVMVLISRAAP